MNVLDAWRWLADCTFQQFVCVEALITSVSDLFPKLLRSPVKHEIFSFVLCVLSFLLHLVLVTQVSEEYHFHFQGIGERNHLIPSVLGRKLRVPAHWLLWCNQTLWQFRCYLWMPGGGLDFWWDEWHSWWSAGLLHQICWNTSWSDLSSGVERLVLIIGDMTGHRPSIFFKLCWKFFIPLFSGVIETWSATETCKHSVQSTIQDINLLLFSTLDGHVAGFLPSAPGLLQLVRLPCLGVRAGLVHDAVPCPLGTGVDNWAHVFDSGDLQTGRY